MTEQDLEQGQGSYGQETPVETGSDGATTAAESDPQRTAQIEWVEKADHGSTGNSGHSVGQ